MQKKRRCNEWLETTGPVPQARQALDNMKFEIANQVGVNLKQGYNGDLPSRQAGSIGGQMVKRMIQQYESSISGRTSVNRQTGKRRCKRG